MDESLIDKVTSKLNYVVVNYETVPAVDLLFEKSSICEQNNEKMYSHKNPKPIIYENVENERKEENWRWKLTIPKPFKMTIRDGRDQKKKPCKRIESEIETTKRMERAECSKMFRANPVPPTTFFPLYADMTRKDEIRRQLRREQCRELTLAIQKPFDFYYREEVNKMFHSKSMPNLALDKCHKSQINDRVGEEESKRSSKCRSVTRVTRDWTWFVKWSLNHKKCATPKRKLDPPNFNKIHSQLENKKQNKLPTKMTTTCEPFTLHTSLLSRTNKVKDEVRLKENRRPFMASPTSFRNYSTNNPPRLNLAAKLRAENSRQMAMKNEVENNNRIWKNALRRCLSARIAAEQDDDDETNEERLKRKRADTKSRLVDYQHQLDEIIRRVASRPLLMEQQTTMAARKRAERIFLDRLHSNGLTEDLIIDKSRILS